MTVAIRACAEAAALQALPPPRRPWVEPLPDAVPLATLWPDIAPIVADDPGRWAVLGLADDPDRQRQYPVVIDLEASGGVLVFGTGGSGKTTLLRTVAAGLVHQGRSDAVHLYALDFAGRSLASLTDLPQVSDVIMNDEVERTARLLTVLRAEIERRRHLLAEARVENLSALRRLRGEHVVPRIVVLLDSYAGFHSTFDQSNLYPWIVELQRVVTEGRQVGVHVVMTTNRQAGLPSALLSAMSSRVVLRMASADELTGLNVPRALAVGAELGDGRGFLDAKIEMQVAVTSVDPDGGAQAEAIAEIGRRFTEAGVDAAPPLVELPEHLGLDQLLAAAGQPERLRPYIGVADLTHAPMAVDLSRSHLVICGPPMSGRSLALAAIARQLDTRHADDPVVAVVGSSSSPLADLDVGTIRGFGRAEVTAALEAAAAAVAGHQGNEVKLVVVIDAAEDVDAPANTALLDALIRSDAVRILTVLDMATLPRTFSGWIAELKHNRTLLALQPHSPPLDVEAVAGRRPQFRPEQPFPPGRGVLVDRRAATLVQVAVP